MLKYLLAILICLNPIYANANDLPEELRSFGGLSDLLPVTDSSETPRKPTSSKPSVIPFIENNQLSPWINNKTIQKAAESFRITPEQKKYLKSFKR